MTIRNNIPEGIASYPRIRHAGSNMTFKEIVIPSGSTFEPVERPVDPQTYKLHLNQGKT